MTIEGLSQKIVSITLHYIIIKVSLSQQKHNRSQQNDESTSFNFDVREEINKFEKDIEPLIELRSVSSCLCNDSESRPEPFFLSYKNYNSYFLKSTKQNSDFETKYQNQKRT